MKVIMILMLASYAFGYFVGTEKNHIKKQIKRARRNAILKLKNRICNEIYEWDYRHSSDPLLLTRGEQAVVSYKMNMDDMTEEEFQKMIRIKKK